MANQGLQILDDNDPSFKYGGGQWTLSTLVQWYQGTSNYAGFANSTHFGSFNLTFQGTSIAFIGNTPYAGSSETATVSIDGGSPRTITYPGTLPEYIQWYQSPTLSDGQHTISVGNLDSTAVDIALIGLGPNTSLTGKTLFVDDTDGSVQYSGSWTKDSGEFQAGTLPSGFPISESTHRSSTVGDSITFQFTGTSAAIYGIFQWQNLGLLSVSYTLDGKTNSQSYQVAQTTPQYVADDKEASNFLFFSFDNLSSGGHTLVINITDCENQKFILDYITYNPSFSTLASKPALSLPVSSSTSSSSPSSSSTSNSSSNVQHATAKSTSVGAIAGGAVGGTVVFLLLLAGLYFFMSKRKSKSQTQLPVAHPRDFNSNRSFTPMNEHQTASSSQPRRSSLPEGVSPFPSDVSSHIGFNSVADLKRGRDAISTEQNNTGSRFLANSTTNSLDNPPLSLVSSGAPLPLRDQFLSEPPAYDGEIR